MRARRIAAALLAALVLPFAAACQPEDSSNKPGNHPDEQQPTTGASGVPDPTG